MDLLDSNWIAQLELAVQVMIAGAFGGIIGFERELSDKPAGLRTHALLGASAALLVGASNLLVLHFADETMPDILRVDPIRVVEAVVTGTAFIGAGTIFRHHGERVEGLTTAVSLLFVASIGVAVALRQLLLAALVTAFALVLLRVIAVAMRHTHDDGA